jgi:hypothetical protein
MDAFDPASDTAMSTETADLATDVEGHDGILVIRGAAVPGFH